MYNLQYNQEPLPVLCIVGFCFFFACPRLLYYVYVPGSIVNTQLHNVM